MSLYPTLEDLNVNKMAHQQYVAAPQYAQPAQAGYPGIDASQQSMPPAYTSGDHGAVVASGGLQSYPSLDDYLGVSLTAFQQPAQQQVAPRVIAPVSVSGLSGIKRSQISPGVSEVILCKDHKKNVGLKVRDVNKGVFVQLVTRDSPASMVGLRFGDQILSINDEIIAGYSADKVHKIIKKLPANDIRLAVRDRPFERIITVTKDSAGRVGFGFNETGKIVSIVKDSSAARNGVLVDHQLVEIDGANVIGLKDSKLVKIFDKAPETVTITIMPSQIYDLVIKKLGSAIKNMDHDAPEC